jgi:hypothetical protein
MVNLKYLEDNQSKRIDLDALPDELDAIPTSDKVEKDEQKRDCLYVEFNYGDSTFTQKYSPYHFSELAKAFNSLKLDGFEEVIKKGLKLHMKKKHFGMGFARFIPVSLSD